MNAYERRHRGRLERQRQAVEGVRQLKLDRAERFLEAYRQAYETFSGCPIRCHFQPGTGYYKIFKGAGWISWRERQIDEATKMLNAQIAVRDNALQIEHPEYLTGDN